MQICDTFETVPLREEFCEGLCLITRGATRSWDASNQQCITCRDMCVQHFETEDVLPVRLLHSKSRFLAFFTLQITISCVFYTENHDFLRFLH